MKHPTEDEINLITRILNKKSKFITFPASMYNRYKTNVVE